MEPDRYGGRTPREWADAWRKAGSVPVQRGGQRQVTNDLERRTAVSAAVRWQLAVGRAAVGNNEHGNKSTATNATAANATAVTAQRTNANPSQQPHKDWKQGLETKQKGLDGPQVSRNMGPNPRLGSEEGPHFLFWIFCRFFLEFFSPDLAGCETI